MTEQVWHDEVARWERTGRLDQGPCWCEDCIAGESSIGDGTSEEVAG